MSDRASMRAVALAAALLVVPFIVFGTVHLLATRNRKNRRAVRIGHSITGKGRSGWCSSRLERTVDHVIFELASVGLADRPAARRLARLMDRLAASRDQIMPVRERLAGFPEPVGAGVGKPVEATDLAAAAFGTGNGVVPGFAPAPALPPLRSTMLNFANSGSVSG